LSLAVVFLCGCAEDYYLIEKEYYRIKKEAGKIYNNPFGSPPKELERVVALFKDFAKKYPHPKYNLSLKAEFEIANLYAVKEEYDKSRNQLKEIIEKHSDKISIVTEAIFLTGKTYQAQEKWDAALRQYKKIMRKYPNTVTGLRIPVYIARYYELKHQPDKMIAAYQDAIRHYQALKSKSNNPILNYLVSGLLARCYAELKEWENAISTYEAMLKEYMGKVNMDTVLMDMAGIYSKELKQKDKAKEKLSLLIKHYPRSRFRKIAETLLKKLE
jgi:tetratricopeptide (TPR) repeat protein